MFAYEKFDVYSRIVSSLDSSSRLNYSPLIREAFLFCLKEVFCKPVEMPAGGLLSSGVLTDVYPEKKRIKKVGYFADRIFLGSILRKFEEKGIATTRINIAEPQYRKLLSTKQKEEIDFFDSRLIEFYGASIRRDLESRFYFLNGLIGEYFKLLAKMNVDAVLLRCYYSPYYFPIIFACKMLGVTVIDVQHGINGFKHPAYSKFKELELSSPLLPDLFWTWGGMATKMLVKDSDIEVGARVVEGGNPVCPHIKFSKNIGRYILYTHQPQSKGIPVPYDAIKNVHSLIKEKVVIRPHPLHIDEAIEIQSMLKKMNIKSKVEDPVKIGINESLQSARVHVTFSSTCALDALNFGIPTVYCSDYIGDVEKEFSTGLLIRDSDACMNNLIRRPDKALNYSLGSDQMIESAITKLLTGR
ncbi:hypothetical protein HOP62_01825 [Halomonas sp. MCCC 1A17488]|uniref:hypothetical protein n=1 Tax=unclassified Halomonas TaxID=2609666 RepID=UPI0018D239BE|nr:MULTISPECIES: hypothetical protein [unclassified Halomonas]MCE8014810.1 hypothetical protein [Halomonas sp. MCCC 1A17488]MCG3238143.1 hypothetical protein [Halomonas sp. MCCC 1A17488]QPP48089.1 hypothetical protein I4484_12575 [Halomonas sp. SS10-MC5]